MRLVIQRVNHASVSVDGQVIGEIGKGLLILLGVGEADTKEMVDKYVKKLSGFGSLKTNRERPIVPSQM